MLLFFFVSLSSCEEDLQNSSDDPQNFSGALSRGDLLNTVTDPVKLTYKVDITEGNLKGETYSGNLIKKPEYGKAAYQIEGTNRIIIYLKDKFVLGQIDSDFYVAVPEPEKEILFSKVIGSYNCTLKAVWRE